MPTHKEIYNSEGDMYEALIAREDHEGNITRALKKITPLEDRLVLDLGAGTGRLACLLAPAVKRIRAFDISEEMLRVCRQKFEASGLTNWQVDVADHRKLPVEDASADLIVSGWSVSYLSTWNPDSWRNELDTWLNEMRRVLKPGGLVVLFESLGTGSTEPQPLEKLKNFYIWLDETGFANTLIRTDYKFESVEQSAHIAGFFFGEEMREKIIKNQWAVLPECTGVWWWHHKG